MQYWCHSVQGHVESHYEPPWPAHWVHWKWSPRLNCYVSPLMLGNMHKDPNLIVQKNQQIHQNSISWQQVQHTESKNMQEKKRVKKMTFIMIRGRKELPVAKGSHNKSYKIWTHNKLVSKNLFLHYAASNKIFRKVYNTDLTDFQQRHLANGANSQILWTPQQEKHPVEEGQQCIVSQHALFYQKL